VFFLQSLRRLGSEQCVSSVYIFKEFLSDLSDAEQEQLYKTLGSSLGENLKELSFSFTSLNLTSLSALLRVTPRLGRLYLGRVVLLQNEHVAGLYFALQQLRHLEEFHCSLAPSTPGHEEASFDALLISLGQIPTLKTVYFSAPRPRGSQIRYPTSLRALAKSSVEDLTLMNCALSADHVSALLQSNSNLTTLALLQAEIGDDGMEIIVQALNDPSSELKKLYLPGNNLSDKGGVAIARAIRGSNLQVLDLNSNRLTATFAQVMAESLQMKSLRLQFLDVSHNPLGDNGGVALACGLYDNRELEQLNLFCNQISDRTCAALAAALKGNRSLKAINLYNNEKIGKKGAQYLIDNLEHDNFVLERLELKGQPSELDFFLKLNREFRRGELLKESTTEEQYLGGMSKADEDLNSLFYFLKAKPSLCELPVSAKRPLRISPSVLATVTSDACNMIEDDNFSDF
jgi:hypothetical protein